jgi:hypothetical protein
MEWYTLDDALRRDQVIEEFNSFIWTERYSAWGDFQIIAPYSSPGAEEDAGNARVVSCHDN